MTYFDNAASTFPKPDIFYENFIESIKAYGINASRGKYKKAAEMKIIEIDLRSKLAQYFSISESNRIIFTASATVALNQVLQGLDYAKIKTVYISPFEHNSVYRPLIYLKHIYNFDLEFIPFDKFEWNENKTKLLFDSKKPDLVVLNHSSNVFGNILPVEHIFSLSKKYNATTVLDTAQTAGLLDMNMKKLNVDFSCFAGHKGLYGPSGIGGFAINTDIKLNPILLGGTGINSEDMNMPQSLPERYEVGSMNSMGIIGLHLSVKWLFDVGLDKIRKKKEENFNKLLNILKLYDEIKLIYGENNSGVVSCIFNDYSSQEAGILLDEYDISVRTGLHCAPLTHKHFGSLNNGTVRFSVGYFNTDEDFNNLKNVLSEIL